MKKRGRKANQKKEKVKLNARQEYFKKALFFLKIAIPTFLMAVVFGFFFDPKIVIVVLAIVWLALYYVLFREKIGQELLIAFIISFAWTSFAGYVYQGNNLFLGRVNIFPLIAWTGGLVFLREFYEHVKKWRFLKSVILYWACLIIVELMGYHLFGIKINANYPGLFGLPFLHAPVLWKWFYIFSGPIYLLITDYLRVK